VSRYETAGRLGISFERVPNIPRQDGIDAMRSTFSRLWFDQTKCAIGLEGLSSYRWRLNRAMGVYTGEPVHDGATHPADALRYLCVSLKGTAEKVDRIRMRDRSLESSGRRGPFLGTSSGSGYGWMAS
jgi:hypothetical protein